ncbi:hypothetical protein LMH73_026935 [Vibrio splendidus]|nr:hypothetical protein [Vibrio splendidus]MCC4880510.1 hypothetical protein [Vibrio splendidus]
MKILGKAAVIANALQKHGEKLSIQDKQHVLNVLASIESLKPAIKRVKEEVGTDSFIFAKITPKRIEPQHVYGSQVPCDTVHELAVCQAKKNDNGDWNPDLDKVLFRAIFPERVLAEIMFDRSSYRGKQVTLVELNGVALPKYEQQEQSYNNYVRRFNGKNNDALTTGESLLGLVKDMEGTRLTKTVLTEIQDAAYKIASHARSKCEFDLELVSEKLDQNSYHLRSEIQSSVYSAVNRRSVEYLLDYRSEQHSIPYYEAFYNLKLLSKEKNALLSLLSFTEQDEDMVNLIEHIESIARKHSCELACDNSNVNQAIIKIGNPSGSPEFFFGDTRDVGEYFSLDLSNSSHYFDEYGDRTETVDVSLCQFIMTRYQMMELLRTSIGDVWVKATMQRNLGMSVATPLIHEDRSTIKIDGMAITKEAKKLEELANIVHSLAGDKKNNKEHRAKLADAIVAMVAQLEVELPSRDESFNDAIDELSKGYEKDVITYLEETLDKQSHLLTASQKAQVLRIVKAV